MPTTLTASGPLKEKYKVPCRGTGCGSFQNSGSRRNRASKAIKVKVGTLSANVIETPGHTLGHIAYWFHADKLAFVGDTLFSNRLRSRDRRNAGPNVALPRKAARSPGRHRDLLRARIHRCEHQICAHDRTETIRRSPRARRRQSRKSHESEPTIPVTIGEEKESEPIPARRCTRCGGRDRHDWPTAG